MKKPKIKKDINVINTLEFGIKKGILWNRKLKHGPKT